MKMSKLKTEQNRLEILRNCYRLMATGTWDAISVSMLEKNISQTRGAIFYFNKNKEDLFINMIDELFFPVFKLSQTDKNHLSTCPTHTFFAMYKTPFERVYFDLKTNYKLNDPSRCLFNILIQAQNHYKGFCQIIGNEIKREIAVISEIIKGNDAIHIDLDKIYAQSAGIIFLESLS
ncbi:TetR/AcrR family transcriptional regulator [uncultured Duncaniella sp.]|uniref:TetR/AcrR family transcriptional regulator n=2 Tax=uncultured Duncaniella sp. TaxID=2768039 RepID=UPI00259D267E|nr:TetR/AcrR family transcriptional regulator [uncultured Duncaniella sp.]